MATPMTSLVAITRRRLNESNPLQAPFWSDTDLLDLLNLGAKDLWRAICDLFQNHFVTIDDTHPFLQANTGEIFGLQDDLYRVVRIEPRVVGSTSLTPGLIFKPANGLNDPRFVLARAQGPVDPNNTIIWYVVINEGAPNGAPRILVAPQISSDVNLQLIYNQTIQYADDTDNNPIPGESDNALIAWAVAYAHSDDASTVNAPDSNWLAVYATEKANLLKQITPRQVQEPQTVEGMFEGDAWGDGVT